MITVRPIHVPYHLVLDIGGNIRGETTNRKAKRLRQKARRRARKRGGVGDLEWSVLRRTRESIGRAIDDLVLYGDQVLPWRARSMELHRPATGRPL